MVLVGPRVGPWARPRKGSGKAIMAPMNAAFGGRQWFHAVAPDDHQKARGEYGVIRPQIDDGCGRGMRRSRQFRILARQASNRRRLI